MVKKWLYLCLIILIGAADLSAQNYENQMRIAVESQSVYVYHTRQLRIGYGFNIYRKGANAANFEQLNDQPVRGVQNPSALPGFLGQSYKQIQNRMDAASPAEVFFTLRGNPVTGRFYTFLFPEVAKALGRLYIDRSAPIGQQVTYKIEFVDDIGQPTGESIQQTFNLNTHPMNPPSNLEGENTGRDITLHWNYPTIPSNSDDKIIQFRIYRMNAQNRQGEQVNQKIIIRNNSTNEYNFRFTAHRVGVTNRYFVVAVDIAGKETPPSNVLNYKIEDNIPPGRVGGVEAIARDGTVELTWRTSPELDLAGYNVFRSTRMGTPFKKLNSELIDGLETVYVDSTITSGKNYLYQVSAVDSAGNEGKKSVAAVVRAQDNTPPPPVDTVYATYQKNGTVSLRWEVTKHAPDFKSYVIQRSRYINGKAHAFSRLDSGNYHETALVDSGIMDKGFVEGAYYEFRVQVADSARNFSDPVSTIIQIPDNTPPEPPTNLVAINRDGIRVNVSWDASRSGDVVEYIVYRQPDDSAHVILQKEPVTHRRIRDERVKKGQVYIYSVSALDSAGNESAESKPDTVNVKDSTPPRSVRNLQIRQRENHTELRWEPVPAYDLAGYRIYRSNLQTGVYKEVTDTLITATHWSLPASSDNQWYEVRAVDISGNRSASSQPVQNK